MNSNSEHDEWARAAVAAMLARLAVLAVSEMQRESLQLAAAARRVARWKP